MVIKVLQRGDEHALEEFLAQYAETSMFLRSNLQASGLIYKSAPFHGEYLGSFDSADQINGVIAHYWNGNIMIQVTHRKVMDKLLTTLKSFITRPIAGILGPEDQAEDIIKFLRIPNSNFAINRSEKLFSLSIRDLIPSTKIDPDTTKMVPAISIDPDILFDWLLEYHIEALGSDNDDKLKMMIKQEIADTKNWSDRWCLVVNDIPCSLVGFNAKLSSIVQLGPVWTPVELRNKGYAKQLLSLVLTKAQENGIRKSILFTDNPAAIAVYHAMGFKPCGSFRLAILNKEFTVMKS